eukprot:10497201-Lingulodinium_polyedra.AAC.1
MADAGSEMLYLARQMDTEELDTAGLHTAVNDFLFRVYWLFHEIDVSKWTGARRAQCNGCARPTLCRRAMSPNASVGSTS